MNKKFHVVRDPRPGQVVEVPAGSQLGVTFRRRGLGGTHWHIEEMPGYLLPLAAGQHEFQFLVFGQAEPTPLRLVRTNPSRPGATEVCDLLVVPSS